MNQQRFLLPGLQLLWAASLLWTPLVLAAEHSKSASSTSSANGNACAWFNSIDDWRELDNRNLIVWVSRTEFYHLELSTPLIDLDTAESIAFIDHNHDGRVCGFGMDEVMVPHSTMLGRATIISMTRLDAAGLTRLADKYHLKLRQPKTKQAAEAAKPTTPETAAKNN